MAQPPLSRRLAHLERRLGVALFVRSARGVRLTAAGEAFVRRARQALAEVDAAVAGARAANGPGTVRYAVPDHERGLHLCAEAVAAVQRRHPDARLVGVAAPGPGHEQALRRGAVNVGFGVAASADPADAAAAFGPDLAFHPLVDEEAAFALLPAGHPLAAAHLLGRPVEPAALQGPGAPPLASFPREVAPALYARVEEAFAAAGLAPTRVPGEPTFGTCVQLVAGGLAWAFVVRSVAERCPPGTVARRIRGVSLPGVFGVLWRRGEQPPLAALLIEALRAAAR